MLSGHERGPAEAISPIPNEMNASEVGSATGITVPPYSRGAPYQ